MILLVAFYEDPHTDRQAEFLTCLQRNAANDWIEKIHLFNETKRPADQLRATYPALADSKIRLVDHGRRVSYQVLFAYANQHLTGQHVIIANADIYFDHRLARLADYDMTDRLLCLSRWDAQHDGSAHFFDHAGSQDAWIFQAPIRPFACDFPLGVPACDNRLAWEADHARLVLSNPARSLRAYHLHVSLVRRYSQRQRLSGPVRGVPATYLEVPWLSFVIPCCGQLNALRQTIEAVLAQPKSEVVLVDYACPDGCCEWARTRHPGIEVVEAVATTQQGGAEARNLGVNALDERSILCFLDPEVGVMPGFSEHVLAAFEQNLFLTPDRSDPVYDSVLICGKDAYERVGGFDENFLGWGEECLDLRDALRRAGFVERTFPASLLAPRQRIQGAQGTCQDDQAAVGGRAIHAAYRRAKAAILDETGGKSPSGTTMREVYEAIGRHHPGADGSPLRRCNAMVSFQESMGYTIAQLEPGVSSHNNDVRPIMSVPKALSGRQFTQVVSAVVSPVEIEFLTSGDCYVLVGTDWDGYSIATRWLRTAGRKADLPPLRTVRGTEFEVWSLRREAGTRVVLPTQVMLVADQLIRR